MLSLKANIIQIGLISIFSMILHNSQLSKNKTNLMDIVELSMFYWASNCRLISIGICLDSVIGAVVVTNNSALQ